MPASLTFTATDFNAKCLDIFDRLAARKLTRVTITKRGRVVAVLTPPVDADRPARLVHGFMAGSVITPSGFDLTAPVVDEPSTVERDALHE